MGAAISLRADFDAEGLRRLARKSKHAAQARRLLTLALIYGGGSRSDARATSRNRSAEYYPCIRAVIFTTVFVALVLHLLLPEIPLAVAFALGAIVSPPDAVSYTHLTLPTIYSV